MTNKAYLGLALLMAAAGIVHVVMGGASYSDAFQQELSTPKLRAVSFIIWHAATATIFLFGLAYLWLANSPSKPLLVFISSLQLAWAGLFLGTGIVFLGNPIELLHWVVFLAAPLIAHAFFRENQ